MRKIKDVLRLKLDAQLSHRQIAAALGMSKAEHRPSPVCSHCEPKTASNANRYSYSDGVMCESKPDNVPLTPEENSALVLLACLLSRCRC